MIQKLRNKQKKKYFYQVVVAAVVLLALLVTFLPGWLLVWQSKEEMNMVDAVPVEYYSPANLAVARNASANLGIYQKLQLITGRWESKVSPVDSYEREMENYEAVELAKERMDALYQAGIYPTSLLSNYENWYSWEAEFCKVVDATFNTYAAYYWKLTFAKYDGTERHHVYMLEDGTIFLAEAQFEDGVESGEISKISDMKGKLSFDGTKIAVRKLTEENQSIEDYLAFTDLEIADLQWLNLSRLQVGEREYDTLQLHSSRRYLYALQPLK